MAPPIKYLRNDPTKDILAAAFEIENEQTFHLKELYKYIHDFLIEEEQFKSMFDDDKPEVNYFERQFPDGRREHHIWWRFYRCPNGSKYFRRLLKINFQTLNMGKKEVIKNGQKLKLDSGDIIIRMEGYLQLDFKNEWPKHWFLKNWDVYFRKRMYKAQIDLQKAAFYQNMYKIQNKIKQYLDLATSKELPVSFQPQKGMR